ncbi:MAG: hypothetical protein R3349_01355, partial [Geminicoccaceae bacterium]|nr:hypothetical protein [Geminicoccaceae bacterium]
LFGLSALGATLAIVGLLTDPDGFWRAWFIAVLVAFQIPLGCLALLIAWHVMGGRWGLALADALEVGARTLPLVAILFLPLLLDLEALYPWARDAYLAEHEVVADKTAWLNPAFFTVRTLFYLVVWLGLAAALTVPRRPAVQRPRRPAVGIVAAILYAITMTFASFDWLMSLEPLFNSTVYGMVLMSGQALGALALATLVTLLFARAEHRLPLLREEGLLGLGSLLLALVMLWAYHAFMQLLVIWSGDLPHYAAWYLVRVDGAWLAVAWLIGIGHLAIPFFVLLSFRARTSPQVVIGIAALVLLARFADLLWLILPAFEGAMPPAWLVLGGLLAVLGLWAASFLWLLGRRADWIGRAAEETAHG